MLLEVIATTLEDALCAEAGGADRIELVADLRQGGLTPDRNLVKQITSSVHIPVHVMIRPHARSFHMSQDDVACMLTSIQQAEQAGAAALVLGVLTPELEIDRHLLDVLLSATSLPVTFHRAFDDIPQQVEALQILLTYKQIRSVLTSGGAASALQAVDRIRLLASMTQGHDLTILAGSGLTVDSLKGFIQATQVRSVHLGTGVRVNMSIDEPVDEQMVRKARILLDEIVMSDELGENQ